jgi:hypothetical protein
MKTLLELARGAAPYLVVELLLPGGTLIAVLLWVWRNRTELALKLSEQLRQPDGKVIATGSLAGKVASSA